MEEHIFNLEEMARSALRLVSKVGLGAYGIGENIRYGVENGIYSMEKVNAAQESHNSSIAKRMNSRNEIYWKIDEAGSNKLSPNVDSDENLRF